MYSAVKKKVQSFEGSNPEEWVSRHQGIRSETFYGGETRHSNNLKSYQVASDLVTGRMCLWSSCLKLGLFCFSLLFLSVLSGQSPGPQIGSLYFAGGFVSFARGGVCFVLFFLSPARGEITDRVTSFSTDSTVIKQSPRISSCVLHPPGSHSFSWSSWILEDSGLCEESKTKQKKTQ